MPEVATGSGFHVNVNFTPYKVKGDLFHKIFCCFGEVSAIRKPKMMTFVIIGSQIFFADFVIYYLKETENRFYWFIVQTTNHR